MTGGAAEAAGHARAARHGERFTVEAGFVVDASGPGGFLARHLPIPEVAPGTPDTALIYGHFEGVGRFADAARAAGAALPAGPYPDDRAAAHHYLDEGWMYALRFDPEDASGGALTSAGFVLRREVADELMGAALVGESPTDGAPAGGAPEAAFTALLARYPTLAATFTEARPVRPVAFLPRLPHRLSRAAGRRWLLLPHAYAFFDPLFSTGMAWSLLGVERAADLLLGGNGTPDPDRLAAYDRLLAAEADLVADLVAGAWAAMGDFRHAAAHAQLYFAAASFQEAKQRLTDGDHPWDGFLGATDPVLRRVVAEARQRLEGPPSPDAAEATGESPGAAADAFERWVAAAIAPRNLAGLADPRRRNLYPVDLEALVAAAPLLDLSEEEVRGALPRLRGGDWNPTGPRRV